MPQRPHTQDLQTSPTLHRRLDISCIDLDAQALSHLRSAPNLLAFSAGVDSTALFHLLKHQGIGFDCAMVDHGTRVQIAQEINLAKALCEDHQKTLHLKAFEPFDSNFEAKARQVRYAFFDEIMQKHGYVNLITAHQLDDRLEWFLMRLSKGAGLSSLTGLEPVSWRWLMPQGQKRSFNYRLIRPLLKVCKKDLLDFLNDRGHAYFVDESNSDPKYERNFFRTHFAQDLLERFASGIRSSFEYLDHDKAFLPQLILYKRIGGYAVYRDVPHFTHQLLDKIFKSQGILLSRAKIQETLRSKDSVYNGYAIALVGQKIHIAPYVVLPQAMQKATKDYFRRHKIPPKMRPYLCGLFKSIKGQS